MRGSLNPGSYALCSPACAFAGILGNFAHNLSHSLVARLFHRRKSITIHLCFRHNIIFSYYRQIYEKNLT